MHIVQAHLNRPVRRKPSNWSDVRNTHQVSSVVQVKVLLFRFFKNEKKKSFYAAEGVEQSFARIVWCFVMKSQNKEEPKVVKEH